MLLQKIRLQNIRSYQDQEIIFPEGSTLLSGDIGAGKSSLLLAIEFALFGTSRPDLPAESLLRKGAVQSSVELDFLIDGKTVSIKRGLKKEKDTIKQTAGHLIVNNVKKELTAVELKSEIIALLGYPDDVLLKNKNYIYRYTVYCPQEEMRYILQENPELRLDALRKIFNIDKYKNIRENVQLILKHMRTQILVLTNSIQPLAETMEKRNKGSEEEQILLVQLNELEPRLLAISKGILLIKEEIEQMDKHRRALQEIKNKKTMNHLFLQEKKRRMDGLQQRIRELQQNIQGISLPEIEERLKNKELERNEFLSSKSKIMTMTNHLQGKIRELQQESMMLHSKMAVLDEKRKLKMELQVEIEKEPELREKESQLRQILEMLLKVIVQNETILSEAQKMKEKISHLSQCPTCLQEVSEEYRQRIVETEDTKIEKAWKLHQESIQKKSEASRQRIEVEEKLKTIARQQILFMKVEAEIQQIEERKGDLEKIREQMLQLAKENNSLTALLGKYDEKKMNSISGEINELTKTRQMFYQELEFNKEHQQLEKESAVLEQEGARLVVLIEEEKKGVIQWIKISLGKEEKDDKDWKDDGGRSEIERYEKKKEDRGGLEDHRKEYLSSSEVQDQHELEQLNNLELLNYLEQKLREVMNLKKNELSLLMQQEKDLSIQQAQIRTTVDQCQKEGKRYLAEIERMQTEKNRLVHVQEMYHWLEEYFLNLTSTIEKHVMIQIYHSFNSFFQEWFSILIDDEEVTSRIDDSFTPIIEQNGYEISFSNLSGGEKTSAALAYRLALNRVINDVVHGIKTKDLLILDEPTDGFSSEQLDKVREVLDRLGLQQMIIVSHESKIESFVENVIRIGKQEHTSRIA